MSRLKDLLNGEHGSFFKYAIVATVVFLVLMTFINQDNFIRWMGAKVELKTQARQIEQYRKEIDQMERRIDLLTHDRDTLEEFARERFGFSRSGDDVFLLDEK